MRGLGAEGWSGIAMLLVSAGVGLPVLVGAVDPALPRPVWTAAFAAVFVAVWFMLSSERRNVRLGCFAAATGLAWLTVLTAPDAGLMPVLLVVIAALGPEVVGMRANFAVVLLNTAVIVASMVVRDLGAADLWIAGGFYLLIQVSAVLSVLAIGREKRMRRELAEAHVDLQAATVLLGESARSTERLRIARELHDLVGHQLTVLTLELEAARHRDGAAGREHVERANSVARALLSDVRATVGEIRAAPAGSLADALAEVGRAVPGLDVAVDVAAGVEVDEEQTTVLVRAVQEIVTNSLRHSGAKELWVLVERDGTKVRLTAGDDGRGASPVVPGNGLRGLAERFANAGGEAEFDGSNGFRVAAWVPAR
ncbi:histidine kinase [Saccharopolyspora indica]|uniref:sensor histidine kinase n=1 Tax=Saccharopolyspora indica TaxID=1229659 RepID=UPI0022EA532F|nr:histidine kinase [Saccharopolyspora indica]MDA3649698.1 histidine kinase [Saccharopolyspora indica]